MNLTGIVHIPEDAARFAAILCQRAGARVAIRMAAPVLIDDATEALDVYQEMMGEGRRADLMFVAPWFWVPSG